MFKKKYGKVKKHCFAKCFAVAVLCLCCTACSAGSPDRENQTGENIAQTTVLTTSTTARPTEPPTITLTKENIEEYLIFNAKTGDVEMTEYPGFEFGETYVTVTTSSKKRAIFNDVEINITIKSTSMGWGRDQYEEKSLVLPYNGEGEIELYAPSEPIDYVFSSPKFTVEILSVSGTVTLE